TRSKRDWSSDVCSSDLDEVWLSDQRVELIARHITENHDKYTRNRQYSAIFTVQSIPALVKYYDAFKKISKDYEHPLKVAGVFSYAANEERNKRSEEQTSELQSR